jgi:tetratricopeptide (TPR) repeat protein
MSEMAALRDQLQRDPENGALRLKLGIALIEAERTEEAIPEFERAKGDPVVRPEAQYNLARALVLMKQHKHAVVEFECATADLPIQAPLRTEICYYLARIYEQAGKRDLAIKWYEQCLPGDDLAAVHARLRPSDPPRVPPAPGAATQDDKPS